MLLNYIVVSCFSQDMRRLRNQLSNEKLHQNKSMVLVVFIGHGDENGYLHSIDGNGLAIHDLVGTLTDVQTLVGKPKAFFVNACRGGKLSFFTGVVCTVNHTFYCTGLFH